MKNQTCFRSIKKPSMHRDVCSEVELFYILRGTCEATANTVFHSSRWTFERPYLSARSIPTLPHFRSFSASHESDFYTSGSLNSFYFGWVWKINGALGDYTKWYLVSLISRSSNSLLMLNPKLQSHYLAALKCWHRAPTGSAGGEGVPFMDSSVRPAASKGSNRIYFFTASWSSCGDSLCTSWLHNESCVHFAFKKKNNLACLVE